MLTNVYVSFLGHINDQRLEFEVHLIIKHRWADERLMFGNAVGVNASEVMGRAETAGAENRFDLVLRNL